MSSLVLVQNEVTYGGEYDYWQDLTGVSYQYSNQYRNKIIPGKNFIYYRGVRRTNGQQGIAEYFGVGRISTVWRDPSVLEVLPKAKWRWYCSIEDYIPFIRPVPSKHQGQYFEAIRSPIGWRTSVREIANDSFEKIISLAGLHTLVLELSKDAIIPPIDIPLPEIDDVIPIEIPNGLDGFVEPQSPGHELSPNKTNRSYRRTRRSKQIGDRAENVVMRWLRTKLSPAILPTLRWVAQDGETPGWDVEFSDDNQIFAIEVKGTTGKIFQNVEITAQEWNAAKVMGPRYWLVLVTDCISLNPKILLIKNPYEMFLNGSLEVNPLIWKLGRTRANLS